MQKGHIIPVIGYPRSILRCFHLLTGLMIYSGNWSVFGHLPAFEADNGIYAYQVSISMKQELLVQ